jgi:ubiquitin-activating enzyme E1
MSRNNGRLLLSFVFHLLFVASVRNVCEGRSNVWTLQVNHRVAAHRARFATRDGSLSSTRQKDENDEERYSRQVYTVGTRAHNLIRNATVYLDGPPKSGLLYECAKNLALSGIRHLILLTDTNAEDDEVDQYYHNSEMDDLGYTYRRGASAEIFGENDTPDVSDADVLSEYLKRLNPSILVSEEKRATLYETTSQSHTLSPSQAVLLVVDRPYSTTLSLNRLARLRNWTFVATETAGVFGQIFCDFGPAFVVHDIDGETPVNTPLDHIESLDETMLVHCISGERHDVSKGDLIRFQYRNGDFSPERCRVVDVQTPFRFAAELVIAEDSSSATTEESFLSRANQDAVSFSRVKLPQTLSFKPLNAFTDCSTIEESLFTACDLEKSHDALRRWTTMSCFRALSEFVKAQKRLPTEADSDELWSLAQIAWSLPNMDDHVKVKGYFRSFLSTCLAKFTPLQAVIGAIAAQEVMKAVTGLYTPVHQFLLYDCDEVVSKECDVIAEDKPSSKSSSAGDCGLRYILGVSTVDKLQSQKVFVVGSGAIGCEILKNLASMGAGTGRHGKLIVTDMDTIEKSNLSRQLLFRDVDVGKFKSAAAHEATKRLNPDMEIETHSCKVGELEKNNPFDDAFWSNGVDIVLNALDNVDARLYMDQQCVLNKKALVDAGTMGPKGNVQVVVPFHSESYASSVDPPEPSIPVCTLKNFPYAISHTIQWGRELFDDLFQRRPEQANDFLDSLVSSKVEKLASRLIQEKGADSAMEQAIELTEDLSFGAIPEGAGLHVTKNLALTWAFELAMKLFHVNPDELLSKHPLDSVDEEGLPFWSGTRRPPVPLSYESVAIDQGQVIINQNFVEFIRNGARLRVESVLGSEGDLGDCMFTIDEVNDALATRFGSMEKPSPEKCINEDNVSSHSVQNRMTERLGRIVVLEKRMVAIEFEKDDDSNGHVAFVNAASNLRAIVYGIAPVDTMETRRVAGNIVPAMISTTALVSALSCMELVKLVQSVELRRHRNAFVNLALPFFAFTMPLPADLSSGLDGTQYSIWDQLHINESKKAALSGGITMKSLLKEIRKLLSTDPTRVSVSSICTGPYMLYANFLQLQDSDILNRSLWELFTEATSSYDAFDEGNSRRNEGTPSVVALHDDFIDLTVVVEDVVTGEEVELPIVRVQRYRK